MKTPLVSVVVVTYNSMPYVIETLNSIKAQTYQNIELIISDDCSQKDNTIEAIQEWLNNNGTRFVRTKLITVEKNTGVSLNVQRGKSHTTGEWIKGVAGDDRLAPDCISSFVDYINENPDARVVLSKIQPFRVVDGNEILVDEPTQDRTFYIYSRSLEEQLDEMYIDDYCKSPSEFSHRSILELTKYDSRYPAMEDYPYYLGLLKAGVQLHAVDKKLVYYRLSESASHSSKNFFTPKFHDCYYKFYIAERRDYLVEHHPEVAFRLDKMFMRYLIIKYVFKNKNNMLSRGAHFLLLKLFG